MIKAEDLRKGNYVLVNGKVTLVESISESGINIEAVGGYYAGEASTECEAYFDNWGSGNKYVEPIPLTSEILEKCGFVGEGGWGILYFNPRMAIRFWDFNYAECDLIQDGKYFAFKNSHIQYLHQLQNLIHSLTNTELNINL